MIYMKNYKKVIAAATAIAISAAATGSIAYAKNNDKRNRTNKKLLD